MGKPAAEILHTMLHAYTFSTLFFLLISLFHLFIYVYKKEVISRMLIYNSALLLKKNTRQNNSLENVNGLSGVKQCSQEINIIVNWNTLLDFISLTLYC